MVGQRVLRVALQLHVGQQPLPLRRRQLRQEQLACGRAVRRHARTRMQVEAQRRRGLDAIQVQHLAAGERGQVAALAHLFHQPAQHHVARAMRGAVEQQVLRQPAQPQAGAVLPPVAVALDQSGRLELLQHAVQRGLGQAGFFHQRLQVEGLVLLRDDLEQAEQAQRRRVSVRPGFTFGEAHIVHAWLHHR